MHFKFPNFCFLIVLLTSCGLQRDPIQTIADIKTKFQQKIEDTTAQIYDGRKYKSLAFSEMKVYKPEAFRKLDSVYAIKQKYLDNNDLTGLRNSGLADVIPGFRAAAREVEDSVRYEIEHIFQIGKQDSLEIIHDFYLFNNKDSLKLITPFYNFTIPDSLQPFYYDFLYRYHFLTNRDLYISQQEVNFIDFFNRQKMNLVGSSQLQPFMIHTLKLMRYSNSAHSVDFNDLSKYIALHYLKKNYKVEVIKDLGQLYSYKEGNKLLYYQLNVKWKSVELKDKTSRFTFSPYLELQNVTTSIDN